MGIGGLLPVSATFIGPAGLACLRLGCLPSAACSPSLECARVCLFCDHQLCHVCGRQTHVCPTLCVCSAWFLRLSCPPPQVITGIVPIYPGPATLSNKLLGCVDPEPHILEKNNVQGKLLAQVQSWRVGLTGPYVHSFKRYCEHGSTSGQVSGMQHRTKNRHVICPHGADGPGGPSIGNMQLEAVPL